LKPTRRLAPLPLIALLAACGGSGGDGGGPTKPSDPTVPSFPVRVSVDAGQVDGVVLIRDATLGT
jgi:hypothetical protein